MAEAPEVIFKFLEDSLKVAGSPYTIIQDELIMAQCQVQIPRTFFRSARTETMNFQLVCKPDLLPKYPGSELVIQGSYRLQWFVDGIRERGLVTRGTYRYDLDPRKTQREIKNLLNTQPQFYFEQPSLSYQPHLLVNFKVALETDEKSEEQYSLSINLVNGDIHHNLMIELMAKKITPEAPRKPEKRCISYREGFGALINHLTWLLKNHDHQWLDLAKARWEEEITYLESYYDEHLNDLNNNYHEHHLPDRDLHNHHSKDGLSEVMDETSYFRRIAETYRKFQPFIRIKPCNIGLLYLPMVTYTVEPFINESNTPTALIYDPLLRKIHWLNTQNHLK